MNEVEKPAELPEDYLKEPIVAFYSGESPDSEGRMLEQIWSWDYQKLEAVHDFIQWLFPLTQPSGVNADAPLVNDSVIEAFVGNDSLRTRLNKSLETMLRFYGLECNQHSPGSIEIFESDEYETRKRNWISPGNHNYLRLTRILISLKLLGMEKHARALFERLDRIYARESKSIGSRTYGYWESAINKSV